ncbi:MAG: FAD-dependent monooxygenase [Hyphomonadaceae bacterium]|nr:FAD-dependent monooxygenase [Hyphomonadaceae bacterium]MBC6411985.1 FAD-dependent monooxygenase [Hyphomonadaceae bacterium]
MPDTLPTIETPTIEAPTIEAPTIETDVLVIGTGPAGSACALTLVRNGIKPMVVNKYGWTAQTPRAHITNPRTMEVLSDLGVKDEALRHAVPHTMMGENTFCASLSGPEFGRIPTWGTDPDIARNYALASPETNYDITQNLMEPVLLGNAAHSGANVQFHTEFLHYEQDTTGVTSTLQNRLTGQKHYVRSRYLVGADGANSTVARIADLPLEGTPDKEGSMNIVFNADLSEYVAHRQSVLYWVIQDGSDVGGLGMGVVRMVRPWNRWLAIWGYDLNVGQPDVDEEKAVKVVHDLVGDDTINVEIDSISFWKVNEVYATHLQDRRVFCMGDAVHRHPPTKGLGSNTSIQDGYNLGWKLALVIKGRAGESLLESYSQERAPVARQVVTGANRCIRTFFPIIGTLGLMDVKSPEEAKANVMSMLDDTEEAKARRDQLIDAVAGTRDVFDNPGIEICHRYESAAVDADFSQKPEPAGDLEVMFENTTFPGARMVHAWILKNGRKVSTLNVCGHYRFTLFTGISGKAWSGAAETVSHELGVNIETVIIGPGQKHQDVFGDYRRLREVEESGAILVRPDQHIGWRALKLSDSPAADLRIAMKNILGL